jgi:hypothetical protein
LGGLACQDATASGLDELTLELLDQPAGQLIVDVQLAEPAGVARSRSEACFTWMSA